MKRKIVICDYCNKAIGFEDGYNEFRCAKIKYPSLSEYDLCQNCFDRVIQVLTEIENENKSNGEKDEQQL